MRRRGEHDRYRVFSRRAVIMGGSQLALFSALAGRMYYLQVIESDRYATLAEDNRINMRLLAPPRGDILDRHGEPLAVNTRDFRAVLIAEGTNNVEGTLDAVSQIISLDEAERARILRELRRNRSFVPVTLREGLSWEEVSRIEVNAPDLPGVSVQAGLTRYYPLGPDAAHALGYVGAVSEAEKSRADDPLLSLPEFRIGKNGIEKAYDRTLRGTAGHSYVEINAHGRVIQEVRRTEGDPGADLTSTLDAKLQRYAASRLAGESAAAVVMDVRSGDILALVSTPGFDPNAFAGGISSTYWHELITNPRAPLTNKAIAGQYAPGSTFKLAVALAAIEEGAIASNHSVFCRGHVNLGDSRFHCWKRGGHGRVDLHYGLKRSCDVFFYDLAMRLGIEKLAKAARALGLGEPVGLDIPGERSGLIPDKAWKRAAIGDVWHQGETLIAGIGQGYVLATPLQLAVMTARIVNGGRAVVPRLVAGPASEPASEPEPLPFAASSLGMVMAGMNSVVNEPGGTAFGSRIDEPTFAMGGKTGTSQVRRISLAERRAGVKKNEDLEWLQRDHALFVGYAPLEAPRYAAAVVVEHGGSGSRAAAPVARDLLWEAQRRAAGDKPVAGDDTERAEFGDTGRARG